MQEAFGPFSEHYDAYTDHPAYPTWILSLEALARLHGLAGARVLDAACGTGKSFLPLLDLGYEVTGFDVVPGMLDHARRKAGGRARLVRADLTDLPVLGSFDLALCLNDVVNYLPSTAALDAALAGLARNLRPGGLLVFDANTPAAFRTVFATAQRRECGDQVFVWEPRVDEAGPVPVAEIAIEVLTRREDGAHDRLASRHLQWLHPAEAIRAALDRAGLELLAVHGQHDDGRRDDVLDEHAHFKAIHVARKRPTDDDDEEVTVP